MRAEHLGVHISLPDLLSRLRPTWRHFVARVEQAILEQVAPQRRPPQEDSTWPNWFYAWFDWERVWPQYPHK